MSPEQEHEEGVDEANVQDVRQTPPVAPVYSRTTTAFLAVIAVELALQLLGVGVD